MKRTIVDFMNSRMAAAVTLVACGLWVPSVGAQDTGSDGKGFQQNRDYFSGAPFENIDTLTGHVILTFTDLRLDWFSDPFGNTVDLVWGDDTPEVSARPRERKGSRRDIRHEYSTRLPSSMSLEARTWRYEWEGGVPWADCYRESGHPHTGGRREELAHVRPSLPRVLHRGAC